MTDSRIAGTRILGGLRAAGETGVVRIENRYDTDIDDLWSALTDPGRLSRWYGDVGGDLSPGGDIQIYLEAAELRSVGRVEVCERPSRLRVVTRETDESWRQGRGVPPFDQAVDASLTADGEHTALVIEISGMPLGAIAGYGAGWQIHAEKLAAYLAGNAVGDSQARWGELAPTYEEMAAAIG